MILYTDMLHNAKALTLKCFSLRAGKLRTSVCVGHIEERSRSCGTGCTSHRRIVMLLLSTWPCLRRGTWKLYVDTNNSLENVVPTHYFYYILFCWATGSHCICVMLMCNISLFPAASWSQTPWRTEAEKYSGSYKGYSRGNYGVLG